MMSQAESTMRWAAEVSAGHPVSSSAATAASALQFKTAS